jgi:hypothetical protein
MKKAWEAPRLVILTRGTPQELILSACKTNTDDVQLPWGAYYTYSNCSSLDDCPGCDSYVSS